MQGHLLLDQRGQLVVHHHDPHGKAPFYRLRQAFELWINPEIEQRRAAGFLEKGFVLDAAQVIMNLDADALQVRLSLRDQGHCALPAARPIQAGKTVTMADVKEVLDSS